MIRTAPIWLLPLLLLSACVPWTVRPIDKSQSEIGSGRPFDAAAYVDSIWSAKVLPAVSTQAVELSGPAAAAGHNGTCFLVRGEGKVLRVDASSQARVLIVDLAPYDGRPDAALEIGPMIFGTVLRDALPFIQFSQFVNQLDYARVGSALNDRVLRTTLASLPQKGLAGAIITFSGAASRPAGAALPEIVPVTLAIRGVPESRP